MLDQNVGYRSDISLNCGIEWGFIGRIFTLIGRKSVVEGEARAKDWRPSKLKISTYKIGDF